MLYHLDVGWAAGGYLGVDAFFVLSGYLITSLLLVEFADRTRIDLREFWIRRARRLLPALLLVLVAVAIWLALAVPSDELGRARGDGLATLFYVANWRFIATGQSYFDLISSASPFEHMWSLAIEEQFYLIWPPIVLVALVVGRGRPRLLGWFCVVGAVGSILAMAWLHDEADPSRAYYGTDSRAHALLIGALLAIVLIARSRPRRVGGTALAVFGVIAGLSMVAFMVVTPDTSSWMYHGGFALFAVATAVLIAAAVTPSASPSPVRAFLGLAPLVWLGRISYGLYLWHWPVQVAMTEQRTHLHGVALDAARVATTVAIAALSYYLVEQPIRRGKLPRRLQLAGTPVAVAGVAMALVLVTANATPPPAYVEHAGDIDRVTRDLDAAVDAAPSPTPTTATPDLGRSPIALPQRLLLVGDSTAASLEPGLRSEAARRNLTFFAAPVAGCGVIEGTILGGDGTPIDYTRACGELIVERQQTWIERARPDAVLWLSSWETADRIVDGETMKLGTESGDRLLQRLMDEAVGRLTATGARVVMLTLPPPAATERFGEPKPEELERIATLNDVLRRYAVTHARTTLLIDLAALVCPDGPPCPTEVDGVVLRPKDGRHFAGDGPVWVASHLLDRLFESVAGAPASP